MFKFLQNISDEFVSLGQLYAYAHIGVNDAVNELETETHKVDGMILLLVKKGNFDLEINLERYEIEDNSFVVLPYGTLIKFIKAAAVETDINMLVFSTDFLHGVNINFSVISAPTVIKRQSPAQQLRPDEVDLMLKYFELFKINAGKKINEHIEENIAASLMAALVYQMVQFHYNRIGEHEHTKGQGASRNNYVHDFIKLVHVHYASERTVSFYADKLCISTKYLSLLVKEVAGRSASRWIDEFVTMEAKNLLRFSGKNVQQVAYALNFTNQSSFGKFFKHMTGMSPTEYQKS